MEVIDGIDLFELMIELKDVEQVQREHCLRYLFLQIGKGINSLHQAGVSHRDLMLSNIILTKDKRLKIVDIDFGGLRLSCRRKLKEGK